MDHCIGFINETALCIYRPGDYDMKNAAYNGHNCKHAIKFKTITMPDGLILKAHSPMAGFRHDSDLNEAAELDTKLEAVCNVSGDTFFICGDTRYNLRRFLILDVLFVGENLSVVKRAEKRQRALCELH